jgi:phospholipase/lecithinase/hemolysin
MPSVEEVTLAPQFDGVAAVVRAIVSELAAADDGLRQKLARAAAADIRARTPDLRNEAARNVMLATAAITCGVPIGLLAGQ